MNDYFAQDETDLRQLVAATAARLIAEDGLEYATAKRKAIKMLAPGIRHPSHMLPSNEMIEEEVRAYQALFQSEEHPQLIHCLRQTALDWLLRLQAFEPYLVGAVLRGTATIHSDIHIACCTDLGKELAFWLIDHRIDFEPSENNQHVARQAIETLSFMQPVSSSGMLASANVILPKEVGLHISTYSPDNFRSIWKNDDRADATKLKLLLKQGL